MTVLCGFQDFVATKFCEGAASFMTNHVMSSNGSFSGNGHVMLYSLKMNILYTIYSVRRLSGAPNNGFLLNALKVVIEMVILGQQNCISGTNKIPEYARDFKKEYLLIIGINNEFKYFVDNINEATRGLFENHRVVRIKYFIKRFLKGQEKCKIQDTSNFEIESSVVDNLIKIKKNFLNFNQYINFCKSCFDGEDVSFIDHYPGFKNIYDDFELFCSKF